MTFGGERDSDGREHEGSEEHLKPELECVWLVADEYPGDQRS